MCCVWSFYLLRVSCCIVNLFIFVVCISNLRYWLIFYVCRVSGLAVFCLQGPKKKDAEKQLQTLAVSSFDIPGDRGFPLNEFYAKPSGRSEEGKYITDTYLKLFIRKLFIQTKLHTSTKMTSRFNCHGISCFVSNLSYLSR